MPVYYVTRNVGDARQQHKRRTLVFVGCAPQGRVGDGGCGAGLLPPPPPLVDTAAGDEGDDEEDELLWW